MVYVTDYGPVRVSEQEAMLLQIEADAIAANFIIPPRMVEKINSVKAACERFAKHKLEGVRE